MQSADKFVVILVRADPNPFNSAVNFVSQCPIMIAHANGKSFAAISKFFEIKRWMTGIVAPEPVVFHRQKLNGFRQLLIEISAKVL